MLRTRNTSKSGVLASLRRLGWQYLQRCDDIRNERGCSFVIQDPDGQTRKVRVYPLTRPYPSGQCHFGVRYELFDRRDFNIFWVSTEYWMLIVPSSRLKQIFDTTRPSFLPDGRWNVNFYLDKRNTSLFMPVWGPEIDFHEYRRPSR